MNGLSFVGRDQLEAVGAWEYLPESVRSRLPVGLYASSQNTMIFRRGFSFLQSFVDALFQRLGHVEGERWEQWKLLAAFYAVEKEVGPVTCTRVGREIFSTMPWPPQVKTAEDALGGLQFAFADSHEHAPTALIGGWPVTERRDDVWIVDNTTLYPCSLEEGTISGVCKAFGATCRLLPDPLPKRLGGTTSRFEVRLRR
jgi:hypothetical protein